MRYQKEIITLFIASTIMSCAKKAEVNRSQDTYTDSLTEVKLDEEVKNPLDQIYLIQDSISKEIKEKDFKALNKTLLNLKEIYSEVVHNYPQEEIVKYTALIKKIATQYGKDINLDKNSYSILEEIQKITEQKNDTISSDIEMYNK